MRKKSIIAAAVITAVLLTVLSGCGTQKKQTTQPATVAAGTEAPTVTPTKAPTDASTEAPTKAQITAGDIEIIPAEEEAEEKAETVNPVVKRELTDHKWRLTRVIKDGEMIAPDIQYGSIIRQTGAYLEFHEDDTFSCNLGFISCEGTYTSNEAGRIDVHITLAYDGSSSEGIPADEDRSMRWNLQQGTISFDYNNVTNEFDIM